MAYVEILEDGVAIRLAPFERLAALRGDVVVPRACVRGAEVLDTPMKHLPRWRTLGTAVPGLAYGTFRQRGRKEFVAVRGRRRALRILLAEHAFTALVVSAEDPDSLAARISTLAT
jgi:hypothetical protein